MRAHIDHDPDAVRFLARSDFVEIRLDELDRKIVALDLDQQDAPRLLEFRYRRIDDA